MHVKARFVTWASEIPVLLRGPGRQRQENPENSQTSLTDMLAERRVSASNQEEGEHLQPEMSYVFYVFTHTDTHTYVQTHTHSYQKKKKWGGRGGILLSCLFFQLFLWVNTMIFTRLHRVMKKQNNFPMGDLWRMISSHKFNRCVINSLSV